MFLHYPTAALQSYRWLLAHSYNGKTHWHLHMFKIFDMGGQWINHPINQLLCIQQVSDRLSAPEVLSWNLKGHYHCHNLPLAASWTIFVPQPIALRIFYVSFIQILMIHLPLSTAMFLKRNVVGKKMSDASGYYNHIYLLVTVYGLFTTLSVPMMSWPFELCVTLIITTTTIIISVVNVFYILCTYLQWTHQVFQ